MKIQHRILLLLLLLPIIIIGCSQEKEAQQELKVGLLLEDTIDDHGWNSKGYQGLLNIHSKLNVEVVFKEDVDTEAKLNKAVEEFANQNVNLVFGHGRFFAQPFSELGKKYTNVHFVSFNGLVDGDNVTSLNFDSYAMGFFAGMTASAMSKTDKVGVIAAFPWQPEVEGFYDGATLNGSTTNVEIKYVEDWTDSERALSYFNKLASKDVDVFYPTGDGYHIDVIEAAKDKGVFAIGYVGDQSDLGDTTVLTSTVQHVDQLYELIANKYINNELEPGNQHYDFQDGIISLGEFSSLVPEEIQLEIIEAVKTYIESDELPTEAIS